MKKPIIGLVGAIGAGKSTVCSALVDRGGKPISADPIGHEALKDPPIRAKVTEIWGARGVVDANGEINRKKLGEIVFPSPVERSRLEHIVHPFIEKRIAQEVEKLQEDPDCPFIILDAAIMVEAGWNEICDKLIYVDAPREFRLQRVKTQRNWTDEQLANREAVQMPPEKKKELADAIIDNSGTIERTDQQVSDIVREWKLV